MISIWPGHSTIGLVWDLWLFHTRGQRDTNNPCSTSDCFLFHLLCFRVTEQPTSKEAQAVEMAATDHGRLGNCHGEKLLALWDLPWVHIVTRQWNRPWWESWIIMGGYLLLVSSWALQVSREIPLLVLTISSWILICCKNRSRSLPRCRILHHSVVPTPSSSV